MTNGSSSRANRLAKGVSALLLGVLSIFALLLVLLGLFARPGSDGISRVHGHPVLTVLSGSMKPVFDPGDMIVDNPISPANAARLAAGNIITFHVANSSSNNLITHRIFAVKNTNGQVTYQTKGDANNAPDPEPVTPQQIVGTYRSHIPYGGYVLQWAQQKIVFFVIIIVPVIYLVAMQIAKHWNETDKGGNADAADQEPDTGEGPTAPEPVMVGSQTDRNQPNHGLYPMPSVDGPDSGGGGTSS